MHQSFVENNITARGRLLASVGQIEADRLARSYGLRNISDPRKGTVTDANGNSGAPKRANPWAEDGPQAEAKRINIIKSLGTRVASEFAKAAGKTLAGTPLRAR